MTKRPIRFSKNIHDMEAESGPLFRVTFRDLDPRHPVPTGTHVPSDTVTFMVLAGDVRTCGECCHRSEHIDVGYFGGCSFDDIHVIAVCNRCAAVEANNLPHRCEIIDYMRWSMFRLVANHDLGRSTRRPRCQR